mmetsp:Transcript_48969/g.150613  ORF Transcript_48969/g.150613 Transcript_48969/m.150613 type:complete len:215 (+) Transcript_48969:35-679(+)
MPRSFPILSSCAMVMDCTPAQLAGGRNVTFRPGRKKKGIEARPAAGGGSTACMHAGMAPPVRNESTSPANISASSGIIEASGAMGEPSDAWRHTSRAAVPAGARVNKVPSVCQGCVIADSVAGASYWHKRSEDPADRPASDDAARSSIAVIAAESRPAARATAASAAFDAEKSSPIARRAARCSSPSGGQAKPPLSRSGTSKACKSLPKSRYPA